MEFLASLSSPGSMLPHGYCFTWNPGLLWSMVGADSIIALSYFSIPIAIVSYVRKRPALAANWVPWLFCAFIVACGITHLMDIWTIWVPDYRAQAVTKVVTAGISMATALALWPLMPSLLKVPSKGDFEAARHSLATEKAIRLDVEESLAHFEQTLAVTLVSIEAGFISSDRDGLVLHMNAVAERITGWAMTEARGKSLWEVFNREGRPDNITDQSAVEYMIENDPHQPRVLEVMAISRAGIRTPVLAHGALIRGVDGEPRGMTLVMRDISRQQAAETEASQLAAIVSTSNDAIISKSLDGHIRTWNQAAEKMFGYEAGEAIGQNIGMLIPHDRVDEEVRILSQVSHGETVASFETLRKTKDGRQLAVSVTISPIRSVTGEIIGASKIVRDVSMQRQAEFVLHQLEAENRQIQEANRLKSLFLANMSHELRTPLNAVIGFADLLGSGALPPGSPKHAIFLGYIGTSGRHLLKLINDVLDLAKIESGKFEFAPVPLHLKTLIGEVKDVLQSLAQRKVLTIDVDIDPSVDNVVLDPGRLRQVLYNLLSNAIKFSHEGGEIQVRAMAEGAQHLRLEVEDHGIGIAKADLPRLFSEFQQLDGGVNKSHEGTGLGLALSRRLVEAQGGGIGVESTFGSGSTFYVILNRIHGTDLNQPAPLAGKEPRLPHLLVVQPASDNRARLVHVLTNAGFVVDAVTSGAEAIAQAKVRNYDAMTLDLMLGEHEGLATLASLRSKRAGHVLTVVGVSVDGTGMSFAVSDILEKPLRVDEIVAAMAPYRKAGPERSHVVVIDDDPVALDVMKLALSYAGVESVCFDDGRIALAALDEVKPDCIVLDLLMPKFDGFAVLDALSRLPRWKDTPVFIWTSMSLTDQDYKNLSLSARAVVKKGGGELESMLIRLQDWTPASPGPSEGDVP